jgi:hypothetical protein
VVTDSVYGRNSWELILGIVGTDSRAELVPECSTSRNIMYSLNMPLSLIKKSACLLES